MMLNIPYQRLHSQRLEGEPLHSGGGRWWAGWGPSRPKSTLGRSGRWGCEFAG